MESNYCTGASLVAVLMVILSHNNTSVLYLIERTDVPYW
jgi:hypothetical protein